MMTQEEKVWLELELQAHAENIKRCRRATEYIASKDQIRILAILMGEVIVDRQIRIAVLNMLVDRQITSSKELYMSEASYLISQFLKGQELSEYGKRFLVLASYKSQEGAGQLSLNLD